MRREITIYDGQLNDNTPDFDIYLNDIQKAFKTKGWTVNILKLREMNVSFCVGCFDCWLKTPGLCCANDDGDILRKAWINSDLIIFASPLEAGFASSLIKTMIDKFLPIALPFIKIENKEMCHYHRYDKYPAIASIFSASYKDSEADLLINHNWIKRFALQMNEPRVFAANPTDNIDNISEKVSRFFSSEKTNPKADAWPEPLINPILPKENAYNLLIINGSLRIKSNTAILAEHIKTGFEKTLGNSAKILKLNNKIKRTQAIEEIKNSNLVLIAMPLYVHAMPGVVKLFFEEIENSIDMQGKRIAFLIQSGFTEAHHSRWLEQYLARLPKRWRAKYAGTLIHGGIEGLQFKPDSMNKKVFQKMENIGEELAQIGALSEDTAKNTYKTESLSGFFILIFKLFQKTGLTNFFWHKLLKENNAFEKRFARPLYDN